jgi:hypothetical protein
MNQIKQQQQLGLVLSRFTQELQQVSILLVVLRTLCSERFEKVKVCIVRVVSE